MSISRTSLERYRFVEASGRHYPADFEPHLIETIERVSPFTLTTPERLAALCSATEHIIANDVQVASWKLAFGAAAARWRLP